jgi:hypothetical protein
LSTRGCTATEWYAAGALNLLHGISTYNQLVLFSQEDEVLRWAETVLAPPRDRLHLLAEARTKLGLHACFDYARGRSSPDRLAPLRGLAIP